MIPFPSAPKLAKTTAPSGARVVRLPLVGDSAPIEAGLHLLELPVGPAPRPSIGLVDEGEGADELAPLLDAVLAALQRYHVGEPTQVLALGGLSPAALRLLGETFGEGEVRAVVQGAAHYTITETALPGVWRIATHDAAGALLSEHLEVGDVPAVMRAAAALGTQPDLDDGPPPEGAMNVRPLLGELRHRMRSYRPGEPNHVVSLTLLPLNDVDLACLAERLGHGPLEAESGGYGTCRVRLSGRRHIWSVQHENTMGVRILDTLEIGDVPVGLSAAQQDLDDSAVRLAELLGVAP